MWSFEGCSGMVCNSLAPILIQGLLIPFRNKAAPYPIEEGTTRRLRCVWATLEPSWIPRQ